MKRGRPRKYEPRWTGNIKPNGQKELVWVKIERTDRYIAINNNKTSVVEVK